MTRTATFHDLDGKSVFITGGGSGIGAALTDGFMAQGARVAFVQRSEATGFCDEMEAKHGTRPLFMPCDITDISALRSCIATAGEKNGPVTALVNNAANDKRHGALDVDESFWDWSQAINLKAYFFACQAVIPAMRAAGRWVGRQLLVDQLHDGERRIRQLYHRQFGHQRHDPIARA